MKYILIVIILVSILALSCTNVPDTPAVAVATAAQITDLQTKIDAANTQIALKANKTDLTAGVSKDYVDLKVATIAAPNMANYMQKTDALTDAQITAFITALTPAQVTALQTKLGTTSGSGGTVQTTGTITTLLDPSAPAVIGNSLGYSFIAKFKNTGTTTLYVSPNIKATQTTGSATTSITAFTATTSTASYAPITFTYAPNVFPTTVGTTQIRAIATGGGYNSNGQIPIFGNSEAIVTFTITLSATVATQWNFTVEQ